MVSVIYEDEELLVLRKKAGIPVQTKRFGEKDMVSLLRNYRAGKGEEPYIGVVHRLDQPVEGVMVFAKTPEAAADLCRQFSGGQTEKSYRALVCVQKDAEIEIGKEYTLTDYLVKDGKNNCSFVAAKGSPGAKKAVLSYSFLSRREKLAQIMVRLQTGRHHQIRVQMSHAGMGLLGDYKYADEQTKKLSDSLQQKQIALCAYRLEFVHPATDKRLSFQRNPEEGIFQNFSI